MNSKQILIMTLLKVGIFFGVVSVVKAVQFPTFCESFYYGKDSDTSPGYQFIYSKSDLTGTPIYFCQAHLGNEIIPGYFLKSEEACIVGRNGYEMKVTGKENYHLLYCTDSAREIWFQGDGGSDLPYRAVNGGKTEYENTLFVVVCKFKFGKYSHFVPGMWLNGSATAAFQGEEKECLKYNYLTCADGKYSFENEYMSS